MKADKIKQFMELAGQQVAEGIEQGDEAKRKLGAQLLLSEVLEYVVHGLGVIPEVDGTPITQPDKLRYLTAEEQPDMFRVRLGDALHLEYFGKSICMGQIDSNPGRIFGSQGLSEF